MAIALHPVTQDRWPELETLFQARGGPGHCWCMVWRDMPGRATAGPADRKAALLGRVQAGQPIGVILTLEGQPIGW